MAESLSSANSTPLLIVSRMVERICSTLFWLWTYRTGCQLLACSIQRKIKLTPDLVDKRWSRGVLGVIDAVRSELGSESRIRPGEVWGRGSLLVLGRDGVDELSMSVNCEPAGPSPTYLITLGLSIGL